MSSSHRSQHHKHPRMPFYPQVSQYNSAATDYTYPQQAYRGPLVHPRPVYAVDTRKALRLAMSSPTYMSSQKPSSSQEHSRFVSGSSSGSDRTHQSTSLTRSHAVSRGKEQPRRRRRDASRSRPTTTPSSQSPPPPRRSSTHGLKPSAKYPGYYEDTSPSASPGLVYNPSSYTDFQYQPDRPMRDSTNVLPRYYGTGGTKSTHKSTSASRKTTEESASSHKSSRGHRGYDSRTGQQRSGASRMETVPLSPLRRMVPPPRPHPMPGFGNSDDKYKHGYLWTTKYNPATGRTEVAFLPKPPPDPRTRPTGVMSWMRSCVRSRD